MTAQPSDQQWNRNMHYHSLLVALAPATRALDVGCGGGLLSRELAPRCTSVIGIDLHEPSIAEARAMTLASNVEYIVGDVLTHDFEAESFDLVVSVAALHHLDAEAGLRRFAELLRPGGRLGVVGIGRSVYPRDLARDVLAGIATQVHLRAHGKTPWNHSAPIVWPPPLTDRQMRKVVTTTLPGAEFRRRLHGRHSIIWTKPPT